MSKIFHIKDAKALEIPRVFSNTDKLKRFQADNNASDRNE